MLSAHPVASHFSQATALSKVMSRSVPNAASYKSTSTRISASCPARTRGRGPRLPPPPKNASMMSPKPLAPPNPPYPPKPLPPASYI
ncbi:unannotated protein [freshwater metagenome]|uniref:Unannotated protein n=1 Tax=freshwater metagenome TaxID=449393 RepID=A0A6J6UNQ0_9ZZZZ